MNKIIYYTIFDSEEGMFLCNGGLLNITQPDTPTAQAPTPVRGEAAITKRMEELRPSDIFQKVRLDPPAFWAKVAESRPACTIDEDPNGYRRSWDNE